MLPRQGCAPLAAAPAPPMATPALPAAPAECLGTWAPLLRGRGVASQMASNATTGPRQQVQRRLASLLRDFPLQCFEHPGTGKACDDCAAIRGRLASFRLLLQ